ncbi:hypothetical protein MTO96_037215, partial [Rhipicephalus appendiculatus]
AASLKYGKYHDGSQCWYFVGTGKIINSKGYCNRGVCLKVFTTGYQGSDAQKYCEVNRTKAPSMNETSVKGGQFNATQATDHAPNETYSTKTSAVSPALKFDENISSGIPHRPSTKTDSPPFFPEKHLGLRQLFFKDLRGRTFADAVDSRVLCLMAVDTVLPSCLAKVLTSQANDERERISNRLAYLENAFSRRISNLGWISEHAALVQRYQLKRRRLAYFGHGNESCVDASSAAGYPTGKPVEFYQAVARSQQRAKLRAQSASGLPAALLSPLRTQAS